ncbi:glycerol dehydrogenase [Vagococcus sp.]|uniref:glycerol dehydrogenase n=1 Tax=Vagococcus sp. TaxID=1933889 RepID=UPI003F9B4D1D
MSYLWNSPESYLQGRDVLLTAIPKIKEMGQSLLLITDSLVYNLVGKPWIEELVSQELYVLPIFFKGESSEEEIQRIIDHACLEKSDVLIGLGGGKVIDAAKAIADRLDIPVVVVPTSASTDAPTSALSAIYREDGAFDKYLLYQKNPELVLVDSGIISKAPSHLLASGIADALSTWVEVESIVKAGGKNLRGQSPTIAAIAIAKQCEETLFEYGFQAMVATKAKVVTPALEAVIEANTLLSGIGFESGGLAAAHSIHNGFTALHEETNHLSHGEKVAYGTLTQLVLDNQPHERLERFIAFYQLLNLPTTLKELRLDQCSYDELLSVGRLAVQPGESIHQMGRTFDEYDIADALLAVDSYVNELKK